MNELTLIVICACCAMLAIGAISYAVITRQQRVIDALTDKLMARDYGEYKRHTSPLMREERTGRKPQSFYDDPSIDIEDEAH